MPVTTSEKAKQKNKNAQVESLLLKLASGNAGVMEQLYDEIKTDVYAFALAKIGNCADADDIVQDTFVQIFKNSTKYTPQGKPMAWIITIAKNLCFMKLRERKKKAETEDEDFFINAQYNADSALTPEDAFILNECMNELSDEERQIVVLHVVSGFKHREIAAFLDMALPTVLSKYHRALKKLKNSLSKGEREE